MVRLQLSLRKLLVCISILGCIFALVAYRHHQYRVLVPRSSEFYRLYEAGDKESAYKFMTPDYRQRHSLPEFINESGFVHLDTAEPVVTISLLAGSASLYENETGTFDLYSGYVHYWCKVDGDWYFTGKSDFFLD